MLGRVFILCVGLGLAVGFTPVNLTINVKVGERVQLPCRVPDNTREALIQWHLGTKQLTAGMLILQYRKRFQLYKPAPNEMTLVIKTVVRSDEATFTCKSLDMVFSTIILNVQWKPEIIQEESSKTQVAFPENSNAELMCIVSGQPQPNITWHRRPQDEQVFQPVGVTGEKLTIHNISRYQGDVYMCNASNVQGHITWEMNVTVHFNAEVRIYESDMEVGMNDRVIMTCVIQGSPLYSFYWMFEGKKLVDNWKYMVVQHHDEGYPVYFLTMMIRPLNLVESDFGTYVCHADGSGMEAEDSIKLTKRTPMEEDRTVFRYNVNP